MKKNYLKILTTLVCVTGCGVGLSACNSTSSILKWKVLHLIRVHLLLK